METNDLVTMLGRIETGRVIAFDVDDYGRDVVFIEFSEDRVWCLRPVISTSRSPDTNGTRLSKIATSLYIDDQEEEW